MPRDFQTIHQRHADVGEHDIDATLVDDLDGLDAVGGFVGDGERELLAAIVEQIA